MGSFNGFPIRRLNETKRRGAHFVKPVGYKFDMIFILKREILLVCIRHSVTRSSLYVMAIHVNRHGLISLR
jgi:hypothetical protein